MTVKQYFTPHLKNPMVTVGGLLIATGLSMLVYTHSLFSSVEKPLSLKRHKELSDLLKNEYIQPLELIHPSEETNNLLALVAEYDALEKDPAFIAESQAYDDAVQKRKNEVQEKSEKYVVLGLVGLLMFLAYKNS